MKKKLLIIGGIVAAVLAIPSGIVLATTGIEGFEAFVQALGIWPTWAGGVF